MEGRTEKEKKKGREQETHPWTGYINHPGCCLCKVPPWSPGGITASCTGEALPESLAGAVVSLGCRRRGFTLNYSSTPFLLLPSKQGWLRLLSLAPGPSQALFQAASSSVVCLAGL